MRPACSAAGLSGSTVTSIGADDMMGARYSRVELSKSEESQQDEGTKKQERTAISTSAA